MVPQICRRHEMGTQIARPAHRERDGEPQSLDHLGGKIRPSDTITITESQGIQLAIYSGRNLLGSMVDIDGVVALWRADASYVGIYPTRTAAMAAIGGVA